MCCSLYDVCCAVLCCMLDGVLANILDATPSADHTVSAYPLDCVQFQCPDMYPDDVGAHNKEVHVWRSRRGSVTSPVAAGGALTQPSRPPAAPRRREISSSSSQCRATDGSQQRQPAAGVCSAATSMLPQPQARAVLLWARRRCSKRVEAPGWPVSQIETSRRASEKLPPTATKAPPPHAQHLSPSHHTTHTLQTLHPSSTPSISLL